MAKHTRAPGVGGFRIAALNIVVLFVVAPLAAADEAGPFEFERMWPTVQQPWYFYENEYVAVDQSDNIYVSDRFNNRIVKLSRGGQLVTTWGKWTEAGPNAEPGTFYWPGGVAVDSEDNIYVADINHSWVQKFTSDGEWLDLWGESGTGQGELSNPSDVAVGPGDVVYVIDSGHDRIKYFDKNGEYQGGFGSEGSGDGQFQSPQGIAVDAGGYVYLADTHNHRVQKFTAAGVHLRTWGEQGSEDAEFLWPTTIAINSDGDIYVADSHRVQKFDNVGTHLATISSDNLPDDRGYNLSPRGVAFDSEDNLVVTNFSSSASSRHIDIFNAQHELLSVWWSGGMEPGWFREPVDVEIDGDGDLYVADKDNGRIQEFTGAGQFLGQWVIDEEVSGYRHRVTGVAVAPSGYIYVACHEKVWKYDSGMNFVTSWGEYGDGNGQFRNLTELAVDENGNVYTVEQAYRNPGYRVQKFDANGTWLDTWTGAGTPEGAFTHIITSIAAGRNGHVYLTDDTTVYQFTTGGTLVRSWGSYAPTGGLFYDLQGIAVDVDGYIYLVDDMHRFNQEGGLAIKKFSADGTQLLAACAERGTDVGKVFEPDAIAVNAQGKVYVADMGNNRIQAFRPQTVGMNRKSIIVAGGGPFPGNNLWDATQMCANFAYRTLVHQGFTKQSIWYLTSDLDLDLDNNTEYDDVDGDVTNANLEYAITTWAADADELVVFATDHGGSDTFRMSGTGTLSSSDLDSWLDTLQQTMLGRVIVVYDACDSGSFCPTLTPPGGRERAVIASTSPGESAYFIVQGTISFSNFFWTNIFNGLDVAGAFTSASDAIAQAVGTQHPQIDANGDGQTNQAEDIALVQSVFIGEGTDLYEERPVIDSISAPQNIADTNSATLSAFNVTDADGIERVWAVIWPPEYEPGSSDSPVLQLPTIDFSGTTGDDYEATYQGFSIEGTYQIAVYAKDRAGNTSLPSLTQVSVTSPLGRKAAIVAGGSQSDLLWPAVENCAGLAYETLRFQGYADNRIAFLSPVTVAGVDGAATLSNLDYVLTDWAPIDTYDFVLYMVGSGGLESFRINDTETLSASVLDSWLDELQQHIPGTVTVIYDACAAQSFLSVLIPPPDKERIVIAGAGELEQASFLSEGDISFSRYFWRALIDGASVGDAFVDAKVAIEFTGRGQTAYLDDNGNGVGNEKTDGMLARNSTVGVGIMLAADDPLIGSICPEQTLNGETSATIWVDEVTTTSTIDLVWAVIKPPDFDAGYAVIPITELPTLELVHAGGGRYEATYDGFAGYGTYNVAVYAMDEDANVSAAKETTVHQANGPDIYEDDDTWEQGTWLGMLSKFGPTLTHNFHDNGDEDWVVFYAPGADKISVRTYNLGPDCDTYVELYNDDGTRLAEDDDDGGGWSSYVFYPRVDQPTLEAGTYYVRVRFSPYSSSPTTFGPGTYYGLRVWTETGPQIPGALMGLVKDLNTGAPIPNAEITVANLGLTSFATVASRTASNGNYVFSTLPANAAYSLSVSAHGYQDQTRSNVSVPMGGLAEEHFQLTPENGPNEPPVCSPIAPVQFEEGGNDTSVDLDEYVSDPDNTDAELSWTYSGTTNVTVSIDASTHVVTLGAAANWHGSETITFTCTDPGGLWDSTDLDVTVNSVNDDPWIDPTIPDMTVRGPAGLTYDLTQHEHDVEDSGTDLTWSVASIKRTLFDAAIDQTTDVLTITPVQDAEGIDPISLTLQDSDGATVLQWVTLTITWTTGFGDVNGDDNVDALDVQFVINAALGMPSGFNCDLNNDGQVNALDIQLVINAALGIGV